MKTCHSTFATDPSGRCARVWLGNSGRCEHHRGPEWLVQHFGLSDLMLDASRAGDVPDEAFRLGPDPKRNLHGVGFVFHPGAAGDPLDPTVLLFMPSFHWPVWPPKNPANKIKSLLRGWRIALPCCDTMFTGHWCGPDTTFAGWGPQSMMVATIDDAFRDALAEVHQAIVAGRLAIRFGSARDNWPASLNDQRFRTYERGIELILLGVPSSGVTAHRPAVPVMPPVRVVKPRKKR